jgi:F-type H+-transporting ATPase subunit delta
MKNMHLASRYARALYNLAKETDEQDLVFDQMRIIGEAFQQDKATAEFLHSPLIQPVQKMAALEKVFSGLKTAEALKNFILVLAKRNRLGIFAEILTSYQAISDEAHGVTRGVVRSAAVLDPAERKRIAELVSRATKKQVILTYSEDPKLLGGLVAEVGSFTFDDSLTSHLKRIDEQLTRSTH